MKPVVSSIVALALAIAPFAAMASSETSDSKPVAAKVVKHRAHKKAREVAKTEKASKSAKADRSAKSDKAEKSEKSDVVVRVKHGHESKLALKTAVHHAHNVDVAGAGHKEPKVEKNVTVVPASLTTKITRTKATSKAAEAKPTEMPSLPNPNATKASQSGSEKSSRKRSEKKSDASGDKDGGQPERDGESFADLVARIRSNEAATSEKADRKARKVSAKAPPCTKEPIEIIRGPEIDRVELTKCDGTVAPLAVEHLSVLVRPGSAARPVESFAELAKKKGGELARGIHRIDPRLALRLQALADHFNKPGAPIKLSVVSGLRPTSIGSTHSTGRAIDFRIEGTKNEDVVAFCKTLTDTGCGYYPKSSFVHLDVREPGAGHVSWIDASGPGETPHYVSAWPLSNAKGSALEAVSAKQAVEDQDGMPEVSDETPAASCN